MQCPDCKQTLIKENLKKVEIDRCPTCAGMWLDHGELNKLADKRNRMLEFNAVEYDDGIHKDNHPKRNCPHCETPMKKVDMEAGGKIIYDYCSTCKGFWLDKKELADTRSFMKGKTLGNKDNDTIILLQFAGLSEDPIF